MECCLHCTVVGDYYYSSVPSSTLQPPSNIDSPVTTGLLRWEGIALMWCWTWNQPETQKWGWCTSSGLGGGWFTHHQAGGSIPSSECQPHWTPKTSPPDGCANSVWLDCDSNRTAYRDCVCVQGNATCSVKGRKLPYQHSSMSFIELTLCDDDCLYMKQYLCGNITVGVEHANMPLSNSLHKHVSTINATPSRNDFLISSPWVVN